MKANIFFYNFAWKDFGEASMVGLLDMVKVLSFALSEGKVAVHCHAGLGRTGKLNISIYSILLSFLFLFSKFSKRIYSTYEYEM